MKRIFLPLFVLCMCMTYSSCGVVIHSHQYALSNSQNVFECDELSYKINKDNPGTVECVGLLHRQPFEEVEVPAVVKNRGTSYRVTSIADNAFCNQGNVEYIYISEGISSIGNNAFIGCENLKSITLPKGIESIGENTFKRCKRT